MLEIAFAAMADFADYYREIYMRGLGGEQPPVPVSVAELERQAIAAMEPRAANYVGAGAGSEDTIRANAEAFRRHRIVPRMISSPFMPDDGEQRPSGPPDYKVYRSRRSLSSRLKSPDLSSLRERAKLPGKRPKRDRGSGEERPGSPSRVNFKRVLKWVGIAALGWILLSFLAFAVSAQLQSFKLSGEAKDTLHGNPLLLPSAQTILVLGTDARPPDTKEPGAAPSQKCFEQQSHGDKPHDGCFEGEFRADTLMLIRAGGGAFRKLSIPRDTYAEIPGQAPQKINAAFAFGGAALQIKTIEQFLGIPIDHVAIVDFTGFEDLIDAVGGVKVDVPVKICADISGGAGGGQGGGTIRLGKGENTLRGEKALIYSRIRHASVVASRRSVSQ